jgi:hypothetical protein
MQGQIERRSLKNALASVTLEDREDGQKQIIGYAAVFYDGTPQTEYQLWEGAVERIMPGAFDRAIKEDDCRALFNHNPDCVLGRTSAGTCRLSVDPKGLRYEISPPDTQLGRDLRVLLERGDISGSSFSFQVTSQEWHDRVEIDVREIYGVKLYDVGPVAFPAYDGTTAGVRSYSDVIALRLFEEARQAHANWRQNEQDKLDADAVEVTLATLNL